jgi:hypothetical protein
MSSDLEITAIAAFHDPVEGSWLSWLPAEGECALDPVHDDPASTFLDVGEWIYLNSGSHSIGLRRTSGEGGPSYKATSIDEADFVRTASYDLSVPTGGAQMSAFDLADAVTTPQGFSDVQPWQMLYVEPARAFSAVLDRAAATVTWAPDGGSGTFVVLVGAWDPQGTTYLGSLVCRGPDDGSMTLPSAWLADWPRGALLAVYLYRWEIDASTVPANGGTLEAVAQVGVMGTAVLY